MWSTEEQRLIEYDPDDRESLFMRHVSLTKPELQAYQNGVRLFCLTGNDFGRALQLIAKDGDHLLFKMPGHTGWSGRGKQKYYPMWYVLVEVLDSETGLCRHRSMYKSED